jgi:hypothetical protein
MIQKKKELGAMDWSLPAYRFSGIYKRRSHGLERAMDWSFPEVSLRVPSCVLIFFHYFNSEKMGYFTIRVSQRIPAYPRPGAVSCTDTAPLCRIPAT